MLSNLIDLPVHPPADAGPTNCMLQLDKTLRWLSSDLGKWVLAGPCSGWMGCPQGALCSLQQSNPIVRRGCLLSPAVEHWLWLHSRACPQVWPRCMRMLGVSASLA